MHFEENVLLDHWERQMNLSNQSVPGQEVADLTRSWNFNITLLSFARISQTNNIPVTGECLLMLLCWSSCCHSPAQEGSRKGSPICSTNYLVYAQIDNGSVTHRFGGGWSSKSESLSPLCVSALRTLTTPAIAEVVLDVSLSPLTTFKHSESILTWCGPPVSIFLQSGPTGTATQTAQPSASHCESTSCRNTCALLRIMWTYRPFHDPVVTGTCS